MSKSFVDYWKSDFKHLGWPSQSWERETMPLSDLKQLCKNDNVKLLLLNIVSSGRMVSKPVQQVITSNGAQWILQGCVKSRQKDNCMFVHGILADFVTLKSRSHLWCLKPRKISLHHFLPLYKVYKSRFELNVFSLVFTWKWSSFFSSTFQDMCMCFPGCVSWICTWVLHL